MMQRTITVQSEEGLWVVVNDDPRIRALFDCDMLPTPWFDTVERRIVQRELEVANPEARIVFA